MAFSRGWKSRKVPVTHHVWPAKVCGRPVGGFRGRLPEGEPGRLQALDAPPHPRRSELLQQHAGGALADAVDGQERAGVSGVGEGGEPVDVAPAGVDEQLGDLAADLRDAQRGEHDPERLQPARLDALPDLRDLLLAETRRRRGARRDRRCRGPPRRGRGRGMRALRRSRGRCPRCPSGPGPRRTPACPRTWSGQPWFTQKWWAPSFSSGSPHEGHAAGMRQVALPFSFFSSTRSTAGMTSPRRDTATRSPTASSSMST